MVVVVFGNGCNGGGGCSGSGGGGSGNCGGGGGGGGGIGTALLKDKLPKRSMCSISVCCTMT